MSENEEAKKARLATIQKEAKERCLFDPEMKHTPVTDEQRDKLHRMNIYPVDVKGTRITGIPAEEKLVTTWIVTKEAGDNINIEGSYDDLTDLVQSYVLGFCPCARPAQNLAYILGGLELINKNHTAAHADYTYEQKCAAELAYFGSDASAHFFWYVIDALGITEHGGNVSASWLSPKGEWVLRLLRLWKEIEGTYWRSAKTGRWTGKRPDPGHDS